MVNHNEEEDSHLMHFSARGMANKKYSINHGTSMRSTTPRNPSFLRSSSHTTDDDKYKGNSNNYCNERTKSWTDHQKALQPFSSPLHKEKSNNSSIKKKYGYGDLFNKSSSNRSDRGNCMSVGNLRSKSTLGSDSDRDYRRKANNSYISSRGKSDNRIETQESIDRRRPSFTRNDFPLLSPTSKQKKSILDSSSSSPDRQSSWSAVVGKIEKDNVTTANNDDDIIDGIPHLPLYAPTSEETAAIDIDANQVVSSDEEEEPIQASKSYWQQSQQRQRAHSFHHYSSSYSRIKQQQSPVIHFENKEDDAMYHPFSSFTTMSISALQNDIGTLLARSNRVGEAIKRYKLSIESARTALDEMSDTSLEEEDNTNNKNLSKENHPQKKCPKVTEAEGLAWFRQKLLRGDMAPAPIQTSDTEEMTEEEECDDGRNSPDLTTIPFQPAGFGGCALQSPRRLRSASFSVADLCPSPSKHKLSMSRIEQTKSIDQSPISPLRPSKISRNTSHPVTAPHPGKSMLANFQPHSTPQLSRTRSSSFHHRHPSHTHHSTVPSDDIVHDLHVHQKLDCPDEVYSCQGLTPLGLDFIIDPIPVLGSSLRNLVSSSTGRKSKMTMVESVTLIAARLNLASLEYRKSGGGVGDKLQQVLNTLELALEDCLNTKDCKSTLFCQLRAVVRSNIGIVQYRLKKIRESISSFEEAKTSLEQGDILSEINFTQSNETHDDNRIPPQSYLLLVIRLNLSRISCRMNKLDDASKFCKLIAEDNKPHRRNSSRRSLSNTGYQHTSFRRSSSFSATSSALDTAMAAYDHDIDRRAKWLSSVAEHYIAGLVHEANGEALDYKEAWHHFNRLLSLARVKFDHRHVYICTLLERRGAVLFEQRNLGGSMLSYLACMKILEHQQSTGSNIFNEADLGRILYAVGRVLHDNDEYHDAIHMYNRALVCQRNLASVSGRPSLDVITTLCNICRVHHLSGEIDAALAANREVLDLALMLVGGKMEHPFLINRLKIEGNILVEAGRLDDAMNTFVDAARRCSDDQGRDTMMSLLVGGQTTSSSQEDADNGDSSVLSTRSAAALALEIFYQHAAAA